jgi:hypothetical protein
MPGRFHMNGFLTRWFACCSRDRLRRALRVFAVVAAAGIPSAAAASQPTFSKEIAPIFFRECVACHRDGQSAPMPLLTFQQARPWAKAIRSRVLDRSMPPWSADEGHRKLLNERRLSRGDIGTIAAWVDAGAPEGDARDLPAPPTFADEWRIGTPDAIFSIPHEVEIPAAGSNEIKYFVVPTSFPRDRWISQIEVRPSDPSHVHHVIMYHRDRSLGAATPDQDASAALGSSLAIYGPGADPVVYPPGVAKKLPAGDSLVFEIHYLPNGKPGRDRTRLGLRLTDAPPAVEIHGLSMSNPKLVIPPGAPSFEVKTRTSFNEPFHILSVMPHAHLRGKDFEYRLIYPDGRSEVILAVSKYDWKWQTAYTFASPVAVPARTAIEVTAHYDNSTANRSNPDPQAEVRWGWQPTQEMMFSYLTFTLDAR